MRLLHLRGRKTSDLVLRKGRMWKGKAMVIRVLQGPPRNRPPQRGLYVGTFAPTSLSKKAVVRNRMRRRCREALRTVVRERENLPTTQLLLCPRAASLGASFDALQDEVRAFLSTL